MSATNLVTPAMLQALREQILKEIRNEEHPVNSHWVQFFGEGEPAARFGGDWKIDEEYTGRVLVGSGGEYTFGTTGGNKDHKHTYSVDYFEYAGAITGGTEAIHLNEQWHSGAESIQSVNTNKAFQAASANANAYKLIKWGNTGQTGNLPLYKVVAVWKRTA